MTVEQDQSAAGKPPESAFAEAGGDEVAALQAALSAAEARALESRDLYMRALAEIDNVRKRAARDIEHAHKYALDRFANDLITVKDSLELGLELGTGSGAANADTLKSGTEATLKQLGAAFDKAGIVEVVPQGERFNPELHEAIVTQPSTEHAPNTVLQVVQKGYQLNGRLLRPARVVVAREP